MEVQIPDFTINFVRQTDKRNTSTETVFFLMNKMSREDTHLEEGKEKFYLMFDHLLNIMDAERAYGNIKTSIDTYLEKRKKVWGMTQYDTSFYMEDVEAEYQRILGQKVG